MGHRNGADITEVHGQIIQIKWHVRRSQTIGQGNIFLQSRKMNPLLVYKEFPLCHATAKTERKTHYLIWSTFICTLSIGLESGPLAFI